MNRRRPRWYLRCRHWLRNEGPAFFAEAYALFVTVLVLAAWLSIAGVLYFQKGT